MSKIGKQPVVIPENVTVSLTGDILEVKSGVTTLRVNVLPGIKVEIKDKEIVFTPTSETKQYLSNWGTMRALTQNAVEGCVKDFMKELILEGVGFRAVVEGNVLVLNLGFSHQVKFPIPEVIKIEVNKNMLTISGPDKAKVGQVAAKIRSMKKPEPYKGKGFRYSNEVVRRKAGKKAVAASK